MNNRIKELRASQKLTQDEFGKKIGSARNTIANYETGNRSPSNTVIVAMCKEFNVNETWLRTGEGEMFISLDRDDELAAWAGSMLNHNNEGNEFMRKFAHVLSKLEVNEWKAIEKIVLLLEEENKKG